MSRVLYSIVLYLLLPWALLRLVLRSRKQPAYLQHVSERFGFFPAALPSKVIWIHAVSVGETRAAEPLVNALQARYPGLRILISHGTPTGRQTGMDIFGGEIERCYLPYDFSWAARRFLRRFQPVVGIFIETEIWPNLFHAGAREALPLYLVNARMSDKSARGYRRVGSLTRMALSALSHVGAQTSRDAQHFAALGARHVSVTGNIKFDRLAPAQMLAAGLSLRILFGAHRPVFLAASTREGEEKIILDALAELTVADLLAVIVPRHPQRFAEVVSLVAQRGHKVQRRSDNLPIGADTNIVIGDSMGEMFAYYAACDIAFVGGSLLPLGGQNLLEACTVGRPVIVGPHTFNFEDATRGAIEAGAAIRITDAKALAAVVGELLADPARRRAMSEAGARFTDAHRGATEKTLQLLRW